MENWVTKKGGQKDSETLACLSDNPYKILIYYDASEAPANLQQQKRIILELVDNDDSWFLLVVLFRDWLLDEIDH